MASASGRAGRGGKHHGQAGRAHKRSLALQIRELLEDEIQRKAILDDRLGTEEEICARLGTSRHVLRQVIRVLENQGVVESKRRSEERRVGIGSVRRGRKRWTA